MIISPRLRSVAIGTGAASCLVAIPFLHGWPLAGAIALFGFQVVQGFSCLPWFSVLPFGHLLRRVWRNLSPLLAMPFLGFPDWHPQLLPTVITVAVAVAILAADWDILKLNFSPGFASYFPPLDRAEKLREVLHFALGGAVQEYLYRGLILSFAIPYLGIWAVALSTALFVTEHLLHLDAKTTWDKRDILNHAVLGLTFSLVYYVTDSFAAVVIAHTVFNAPNVVQTLMRESPPTATALQPAPVRSTESTPTRS